MSFPNTWFQVAEQPGIPIIVFLAEVALKCRAYFASIRCIDGPTVYLVLAAAENFGLDFLHIYIKAFGYIRKCIGYRNQYKDIFNRGRAAAHHIKKASRVFTRTE